MINFKLTLKPINLSSFIEAYNNVVYIKGSYVIYYSEAFDKLESLLLFVAFNLFLFVIFSLRVLQNLRH